MKDIIIKEIGTRTRTDFEGLDAGCWNKDGNIVAGLDTDSV